MLSPAITAMIVGIEGVSIAQNVNTWVVETLVIMLQLS